MLQYLRCSCHPSSQAVRDSIPLFGVQQSVSVNDSVALDRLSLDDIAPYSRKKVTPAGRIQGICSKSISNCQGAGVGARPLPDVSIRTGAT